VRKGHTQRPETAYLYSYNNRRVTTDILFTRQIKNNLNSQAELVAPTVLSAPQLLKNNSKNDQAIIIICNDLGV
jgi:hypothetical protein